MGPFGSWVWVLVPIVGILAMAGVQILRPLSKRLGDVLELLAADRYDRSPVGFEEVLRRLDSIDQRITRIEGSKAIGEGETPDAGPNLGPGESEQANRSRNFRL
jgi:hypothetical protein